MYGGLRISLVHVQLYANIKTRAFKLIGTALLAGSMALSHLKTSVYCVQLAMQNNLQSDRTHSSGIFEAKLCQGLIALPRVEFLIWDVLIRHAFRWWNFLWVAFWNCLHLLNIAAPASDLPKRLYMHGHEEMMSIDCMITWWTQLQPIITHVTLLGIPPLRQGYARNFTRRNCSSYIRHNPSESCMHACAHIRAELSIHSLHVVCYLHSILAALISLRK